MTKRSKKIRSIVFPSSNKITDDAYQLVKTLFHIEGGLITNESRLEDFLDVDRDNADIEEIREEFIEDIADAFGVFVPEILDGETRVWKVVELIKEKQQEAPFSKTKKKTRSVS